MTAEQGRHEPLGDNYRRLVAAAGSSNFADGVFQIALPLLAVRLTRSPATVAGLTFAARAPWLLFGVLAGVLADRLDRLRTMVSVNVARAALIGGLALVVAIEHEELWVLYLVAILLGVGETMFDTSGQSLMPSIVRRDQLSRANGRLYAVEMGMNQFVGPPVGGVLVSVGITLAFGVSAGLYALAAVVLATIAGSFRPARAAAEPTRLRADMGEGLRFLWRHRELRTLTVLAAISLLSSTAAFALFPLFAVAPGPLGLSEFGFGLLLTSAAAGSLLSSLITERVEGGLGRSRTLALCVVIDGVAIAVLAIGNVAVAVVVGFALGFSQVLWQVVAVSLRQRLVPDGLLGRVTGVHRTVAMGSMVAGAAVGGLLAEAFGIRPVLVGAGIASLTGLLLLPIVSDRAIAEAEARSDRGGGDTVTPVEPGPAEWSPPPVDPDGTEELVFQGGDLSAGGLVGAYRAGLFPMEFRGNLAWWCPAQRGVLPLDGLRISRSLRKACARFETRIDTAFDEVMLGCADPDRVPPWINEEVRTAYGELHPLGWAHSVETYAPDGRLVGGLYGVSIGGMFGGESMFHREPDASKVALVTLVDHLRDGGASLLDVQWSTPHLASLGVVEISRREYLERLADAVRLPSPFRG